jgi:hypothetical protein
MIGRNLLGFGLMLGNARERLLTPVTASAAALSEQT